MSKKGTLRKARKKIRIPKGVLPKGKSKGDRAFIKKEEGEVAFEDIAKNFENTDLTKEFGLGLKGDEREKFWEVKEDLMKDREAYESSVIRQPSKHRPKKPTQQDRIDVMEARLRQRIAQVRLAADYSMETWKTYGPDMDAIKAFQNKRTYKSGKGVVNRKTGTKKGNYKFRTDGRSLFVWDNEVARHSRDGGFDVSSAGYNTPLTMSTLNALGVNAREGRYDPEGKNRIALGSEFLESNDPSWVHISPDKVQSKPVIYDDRRGLEKGRGSTGVKRPNQAEFSSATIARERVEAGIKKGNPPSKTNIQPTDQESINKITGLKTKTPRKTLGVKAHHLLDYAGVGKDLPVEHGGIMLPDDYHDFITQFEKGTPEGNQRRLRQMQSKLRLKIARIRQRNISRINIAQKSVMNLRETRVSDIRRTWNEQAANRKKSPKGFTILDGDVLDLNYPAHTQKILDKYPGKGNVYIVSNLKGVTDIDSPEVDIGFDKWKKLNYTPQAGGFEGGVEMNALFRAEDNEQAKAFTSDFDQDSYTEVRPDGTFGFYDRDGNEKHYD